MTVRHFDDPDFDALAGSSAERRLRTHDRRFAPVSWLEPVRMVYVSRRRSASPALRAFVVVAFHVVALLVGVVIGRL